MLNVERFIFMDVVSAEMTKYATNAMLVTRILFMNEVVNFSEKSEADAEIVRLGNGSNPRIGNKSLYLSVDYGGS